VLAACWCGYNAVPRCGMVAGRQEQTGIDRMGQRQTETDRKRQRHTKADKGRQRQTKADRLLVRVQCRAEVRDSSRG
jgi:hypothetical protein